MADFAIPEFLQHCDVDTIHQNMLSMLPENIDKTEGGFIWDLTRPTAMIASELLEFYAVELLKLIFPQYSRGVYLDMLGSMAQVTRQAAESDDNFRARVLSAFSGGAAHIGNVADYKAWAESVPGVGKALVSTGTGGTVNIACLDTDGNPADASLCQAVYDYIMSPGEPLERLAPVGASLEVSAPELVTLDYEAAVTLADGYTEEDVTSAFSAALTGYYKTAAEEGSVKYIRVLQLLLGLPGVTGFVSLAVNNGTSDVTIGAGEYPDTGDVTLTA